MNFTDLRDDEIRSLPVLRMLPMLISQVDRRRVDPEVVACRIRSMLKQDAIDLPSPKYNKSRNGVFWKCNHLNMMHVRDVVMDVKFGCEKAEGFPGIPLDERCIWALKNNRHLIPGEWWQEDVPLVFAGTVVDLEGGGGVSIPALVLNRHSLYDTTVIMTVEQSSYRKMRVLYISPEYFVNEIIV